MKRFQEKGKRGKKRGSRQTPADIGEKMKKERRKRNETGSIC